MCKNSLVVIANQYIAIKHFLLLFCLFVYIINKEVKTIKNFLFGPDIFKYEHFNLTYLI